MGLAQGATPGFAVLGRLIPSRLHVQSSRAHGFHHSHVRHSSRRLISHLTDSSHSYSAARSTSTIQLLCMTISVAVVNDSAMRSCTQVFFCRRATDESLQRAVFAKARLDCQLTRQNNVVHGVRLSCPLKSCQKLLIAVHLFFCAAAPSPAQQHKIPCSGIMKATDQEPWQARGISATNADGSSLAGLV